MKIDYNKLFTPTLIDAFNKKQGEHKKIFAMLEYETKMKLGMSNKPFQWTISNIIVSTEGSEILLAFHLSTKPTKIIIDAYSIENLKRKIKSYRYKGKQIYLKNTGNL